MGKINTVSRVFSFLIVWIVVTGLSHSVIAQSHSVNGTVLSAVDGHPLPGVNIIIQGSNIGTTTNVDGEYTLEVPSSDVTIIFSFIGYQSMEVDVEGREVINIELQSHAVLGDELIVIGYGTARERDLTGSISRINASERTQIENITSLNQLLQGAVPGLSAGLATDPKGSTDLLVRGQNSISASNDPLIILDGAKYFGDLSSINPNDIESINVLKDASATAIYGASASAGVLVITTKMGSSSRPIINYTSSVGFTEVGWAQHSFDPEGYLRFRSDAGRRLLDRPEGYFEDPRNLPSNLTLEEWRVLGGEATGSPEEIWLSRMGLASNEIRNFMEGNVVDWWDITHQRGFRTDHNISLSGQADVINYYMSAGYTGNEGVLVGDKFETIRARLNLEGIVNEFIKVGVNSQFQNRDEGFLSVNSGQIQNQSPYGDLFNEDGSYKWDPNNDIWAASNPFLTTKQTGRGYTNETNQIMGNLYAEFVNLPLGIEYSIRWSNLWEINRTYLFNPHNIPAGEPGGNATREELTNYDWSVDNILKWQDNILENHNLDITLVFNAEGQNLNFTDIYNERFEPSDILGYSAIGTGANPSIFSDDQNSRGLAFMGRLNYQFMDRYLLTLSFRRDGYTAFGQEQPYANFPSIAAGWIVSDESFFDNIDLINSLRIRASWGKSGNRNIGIFSALQRFQSNSYIYGGETVRGVTVSNLANPGLKWEETSTFNLGLDFGILEDRLNGTIDIYHSLTKDLLLPRDLPSVTGFSDIFTNIGEVRNRGIDLSLNSSNIQRQDLRWNTNFTLSMNRNEIVSLFGNFVDIIDEQGNVIGRREIDSPENNWFIGQPIDVIWDYRILGVWGEGEADEAAIYGHEPGDFKLEDVNGDGQLSPMEDKQFLGTRLPRYQLSMGNSINYKNFNFSFMIISNLDFYGSENARKHTDSVLGRRNQLNLPYWTIDNPTSEFARLDSRGNDPNFDYWNDKSFVRLQNISLSYDFSSSLIERLNIDRLQVYFNVRNAYVKPFSGSTIWDPETGGRAPRNYTLGLNITF